MVVCSAVAASMAAVLKGKSVAVAKAGAKAGAGTEDQRAARVANPADHIASRTNHPGRCRCPHPLSSSHCRHHSSPSHSDHNHRLRRCCCRSSPVSKQNSSSRWCTPRRTHMFLQHSSFVGSNNRTLLRTLFRRHTLTQGCRPHNRRMVSSSLPRHRDKARTRVCCCACVLETPQPHGGPSGTHRPRSRT